MSSVSVESLIEKLKLTNLTPQVDVANIKIHQPDIIRPALQLAGYFEHFEETRTQIIGFVEYSYMEYMKQEAEENGFLTQYVLFGSKLAGRYRVFRGAFYCGHLLRVCGR